MMRAAAFPLVSESPTDISDRPEIALTTFILSMRTTVTKKKKGEEGQ